MTADSTAVPSGAHSGRDDRKSAKIAAQNLAPPPHARLIKNFGLAREILRSPLYKQAGAGADQIVLDNPDHISFFFLDGDQHRKRRTAVANYFSTKTIVAILLIRPWRRGPRCLHNGQLCRGFQTQPLSAGAPPQTARSASATGAAAARIAGDRPPTRPIANAHPIPIPTTLAVTVKLTEKPNGVTW
jgi:hypothetical protein